MAPNHKCIIVDDICDSGKTMCAYGNYENNKVLKVCLMTKNTTKNNINIYGKIINQWVVFPWEQN